MLKATLLLLEKVLDSINFVWPLPSPPDFWPSSCMIQHVKKEFLFLSKFKLNHKQNNESASVSKSVMRGGNKTLDYLCLLYPSSHLVICIPHDLRQIMYICQNLHIKALQVWQTLAEKINTFFYLFYYLVLKTIF